MAMINKENPPIALTEQTWDNKTIPTLTVFNWVYNHKDYIRESIESILMQKTNFKVEIIIHDDASNDGTAEIILEYQNKYPHLFNNIMHSENQWSQGKSVMTPLFEKPKGKYIALTHGDDYWTDPLKLQKQVDFLEKNEDLSLCFHNATCVDNNSNFLKNFGSYQRTQYSTIDLFDVWLIPTASAVYKNPFMQLPLWMDHATHGDLGLFMILGEYGNFGYIDSFMSAYRLHETGVTSNSFDTAAHIESHIVQIDDMNHYFNFKYDNLLQKRKFNYLISLSFKYSLSKKKYKSINILRSALKSSFTKTMTNLLFYRTILNLIIKY